MLCPRPLVAVSWKWPAGNRGTVMSCVFGQLQARRSGFHVYAVATRRRILAVEIGAARGGRGRLGILEW